MSFCFQSDTCEVRLAKNKDEILKAQSLRYHVFYELMSAIPSQDCLSLKRDVDNFDNICDHLLVIDKTDPDNERVVGNYRLLKASYDQNADYFYSHQEYNIEAIIQKARAEKMNILELGRSCVHPDYRSHSIIQMLWRGIVTYCLEQNIGIMFGCASFSQTNIDEISDCLNYLYEEKLADLSWRARAREDLYVPMKSENTPTASTQEILAKMPPLIKGYLRLGAWIGDGAVIDTQFSTTDILIILPVERIKKRYIDFFSRK